MSEKLSDLGLDLPMFPTTAVGSYPKPEELKDARRKYLDGEIDKEELRPWRKSSRKNG